jgi:hypothetical protein
MSSQSFKGLIRSDMILKTFANHLFFVHGLPAQLEVDACPRLALALSFVAVSFSETLSSTVVIPVLVS